MSLQHVSFQVHGQTDYFNVPKSNNYYSGNYQQQHLKTLSESKKHTQDPIVTGTSVIAIKYDKGVVMGTDMLCSYGSLARFNSIERMKKFGDYTIVGAGGELSDFQSLTNTLDELITDDNCIDDGSKLNPSEIWNYLARVLYNRRNKGDPLWNSLLVIGYEGGKSFLGKVDLVGTCFKDDYIASGYGQHIALPLLRKAATDNPNMNLEQAKQLIQDCLRILFYRDARSSKRVQIAVAGETGVEIGAPIELDTFNWHMGEPAVKSYSQY
eukprot:gene2020-2487_t